ncbi:PAS-domain containing protein [Thermomonas sp.]|uniref:hybrid sensor histidine kinase/response regulator n=1 Tax=Thermomonas sp. TaxID=1971895 RepID=UPI00248A5573|nr:PAS-domain containing protein [Thermomonas sp.]MDI1253153.1 PAS-domain containing protein [Thermomonas sp.]
MLTPLTVIFASLAWAATLFGVALWGERNGVRLRRVWPVIYSLSLAVHCTAWTFYGAVAQAARWQFPIPPTYIGIVLLLIVGIGFLRRLAHLTREHKSASIADLVTSRFGKDRRLGIAITGVALLGMVPYISLQLQAVAQSFTLLVSGETSRQPALLDASLWVALVMAVFTMLFGTRRASAIEHNRGIMLALGFESLLKLTALLAVGAFAVWGVHDGYADLAGRAAKLPKGSFDGSFITLVGLGALAIFTLPHQFHVGMVELRKDNDLRVARWLFPLYLLAIAMPVLPIAWAGQLTMPADVRPDLYVMALPLMAGNNGLAMLTFLGGMSAATGMTILSALTLSIMLANHWISPRYVRDAARQVSGADLRPWVLANRRFGIALVFALAWLYSRAMTGKAFADFGILSFSALAQLAPGVVLAVYRPRLPSVAILAGIVLGTLVWIWLMLVPTALQAGGLSPIDFTQGLRWLTPHDFLGLGQLDSVTHGVVASLLVNLVAVAFVAFLSPLRADAARSGVSLSALENVARRFLPQVEVRRLVPKNDEHAIADEATVVEVERELAAVVGVSSARLLIDAASRGKQAPLDTVVAIVGEVSQDLRFNQRLLEAALENMSQGISVVDADLHLVAWNRRYEELFGYPSGMLRVGMPIAEASAWALREIDGITHAINDEALQRRLAHMRAGTPHLSERVFPDGSIVEIRGNPMPGGGFVATFSDVTAFREAETGLKRVNETLEQRVVDRTTLLETAKREAEHANDAKSRFLAAIGHDLLQPLHAAHLFADALQQRSDPPQRELARQIGDALDSTTDLLTTLLDMSRLEAGGLVPEPRAFPLADVLDPLVAQFDMLASERGLRMRFVPTRAWVRSDPQLLRRVLQNFLANALRYTQQGSVLLGVRRVSFGQGEGESASGSLRIEVHDTGPGIDADQHEAIFQEFRRGDDVPGQGLGLGLAIAQRIAALLGSPMHLCSEPGRGSVFAIDVPLVAEATAQRITSHGVVGLRVLVVDNEPLALAALRQVLTGWGCEVDAVGDGEAAAACLSAQPADLWIFDYHLDAGDDGVALRQRLSQRFSVVPCMILSADQTGAVRNAAQEAGLPLLMKPLRPLALKSMLDRMLAARGAG